MSIHQEIEAEREASQYEAEQLKTYRRYARGRQRSTLTEKQKDILRSLVGNLFCDNVLGRVLSEIRNRLELRSFEVAGYKADDENVPPEAARVLQFLRRLWTLQSLPVLSAAVHWAALRDGDHAVSLNYVQRPDGTGRVILRRELWFNGKYGLWVKYDDNAQPVYAVKDYKGAGEDYRTIYRPNRIERYRKGGEGWEPYDPPNASQSENGRVAWTMNGEPDGEPIGLPVVHFKNVQVPQDPEGTGEKNEPDPLYGSSELDGGLVGLQDEINDVQRDITTAARFTAYQMYYGTGLEPPDPDLPPEEQETYTVEPGAFWGTDNPNATFGVLEAGSIEPLKDTLKTKLEAVSRASEVPMFAIQGEWPSGEALVRAEMPLITKVGTIAKSLGPAWGSLMHKATRLENAFGSTNGAGGGLDESLMITSVFGSAERRDELTELEIERREIQVERDRLALERDRRAMAAAGEIEDIESEIDEAA